MSSIGGVGRAAAGWDDAGEPAEGPSAEASPPEPQVSRQPSGMRGPEVHPALMASIALAAEHLADATSDGAPEGAALE